MQSEIIEYARLNQSTIASTKIITERLASFDKASDADSIQEAPTIPIMIAAGARAYEDTLELCLVKVNLWSTRNVSCHPKPVGALALTLEVLLIGRFVLVALPSKQQFVTDPVSRC
jgi:hypothetical protein